MISGDDDIFYNRHEILNHKSKVGMQVDIYLMTFMATLTTHRKQKERLDGYFLLVDG
jgi:hypothetical protein